MENIQIRFAAEQDLPLILRFIRELAEYEKLLANVVATEETLRATLFGPRPIAETLLAYWNDQPVGFAIFFHSYSTFLSKPNLYLEDVYVEPAARGLGIGKAFFRKLAQIAQERHCGRMEWSVLDWNRPSIDFYERLGARPEVGWTTYHLKGDALTAVAEK